MKQRKQTENLKNAFIQNVVEYIEKVCSDHKRANICFDRYMQAVKDLITRRDTGLLALKELLDDSRDSVKIIAAVNVLPYYPDDALKVLMDAANSLTEPSPLALITLRHWRDGTYLDPLSGKRKHREKR